MNPPPARGKKRKRRFFAEKKTAPRAFSLLRCYIHPHHEPSSGKITTQPCGSADFADFSDSARSSGISAFATTPWPRRHGPRPLPSRSGIRTRAGTGRAADLSAAAARRTAGHVRNIPPHPARPPARPAAACAVVRFQFRHVAVAVGGMALHHCAAFTGCAVENSGHCGNHGDGGSGAFPFPGAEGENGNPVRVAWDCGGIEF